jgi:hypothetical protein
MDEIENIFKKYRTDEMLDKLGALDDIDEFASIFYADNADIYDCITRMKNAERNPTGFSLSDAPILGLLVRTWKLLKETVRFYNEKNSDALSALKRTIIEASGTALYLLKNDEAVVEDYRKCSYKSRLRIYRDLEGDSPFLETKAGKR